MVLFTALFLVAGWVGRLLYIVSDEVRVKVDPSGKPTPMRAMMRLPVPRGSPLPPTLAGPDGTVMLRVPEGEFPLGVPDPDQLDGPQVTNTVDGFYIDRTEVTAGQFARFVKASGYVARGPWRRYLNPDKLDCPVTGVTAEDAQEYAKWAGKRLPTEVEWEKAARGPEGRTWPWGDALPDRKAAALYAVCADTVAAPQPVASCPQGASPYGVLDMAGNVWEWTVSEWRPYSGSRAHSQLFDTGMRVIRGGSWNFPMSAATTTARMPMAPRLWSPDVGFRCVVSISK